jgi:uroporphyrinogen decarboxylase
MNALERTINFINNQKVDRPPFHPIVMRFTAQYAGVNYRDFCLNPETKCMANIKCSTDFGYDWVNVMSDPYAEAEAFGVKVDYPLNSLPLAKHFPLTENSGYEKLKMPVISDHERLKARIHEIEIYRKELGDTYFITGWVEGPLAEYCDLKDISAALLDFYENPAEMDKVLDIITDFSMNFITAQVKAGAHCIGIGDAACSLISPELYKEHIFPREKMLIDHAHTLGAMIKLHICGNTTAILPDMIQTGADIIDIDHLVTSMENFVDLLSEKQVFSGNSDPVSILKDGTPKIIQESVLSCFEKTKHRGIVSAGCEIPAETPIQNFKAYMEAAHNLAKYF